MTREVKLQMQKKGHKINKLEQKLILSVGLEMEFKGAFFPKQAKPYWHSIENKSKHIAIFRNQELEIFFNM